MAEKYKFKRSEKGEWLYDLRKILRVADEREFMRILRRHGVKDEHPLFAHAVRAFREHRAGKL